MEKRVFTLVLVVIIGILVGVGIVSKQARDPLLRELLKQQGSMLKSQELTEKMLRAENEGSDGGSRVSSLLQKQRDLEGRVAVLEAQLNGIRTILQQGPGAGGNAAQAVPLQPPQEDLSRVYDIPVAHSPVKGNKNAPIAIVEFVDFQCPFCARFHTPTEEVLKVYPKEVNLVLKNYPLSFHPQARPAAKAAFAAGEQGKYWEMVDALLANGNALSEAKFEDLAGSLGLDVKKFLNDYRNKDAQWEDFIQKDMALAAQVDVRGTPTFYINGRKTGARDFNGFKNEIESIIKGQK